MATSTSRRRRRGRMAMLRMCQVGWDLTNFKMISGLWDDLYLGTDQRVDADVM